LVFLQEIKKKIAVKITKISGTTLCVFLEVGVSVMFVLSFDFEEAFK
jgi:hypothetical protein